jgi:hypothetical protein
MNLVFGNLPVFLEYFQPLRFGPWRDGAEQRFPFGDGKAAVGQSGSSADNNHQSNQQGNAPKPDCNGAHVPRSGEHNSR